MFSDKENWLLKILYSSEIRNTKIDDKRLNDVKKRYSKHDFSWEPIISKLAEEKMISIVNSCYFLTSEGKSYISKIIMEDRKNGFNKMLLSLDSSKVYRKFCQRIHGKFLCQMNMTNMSQLHKLIDTLNLSTDNHILDVACGIGRVSEYISDRSGARITGFDLADEAIEQAQRRTRLKADRMTYLAANLDELEFEAESFDRLIAIDTVYFSRNLQALISNLKRILTPGGMMGIFFSQMISEDEDRIILEKDSTRLAAILKKLDLNYVAYEYTEDEKKHWQEEIKVANELKEEFEQANEINIYNARISEATSLLKFVKDDRLSRYLYIVTK